MRFDSPLLGLLALALCLLVWWPRRRRARRGGSLRYSDVSPLRELARRHGRVRRATLSALRVGAVLLTVVALARPQSERNFDDIHTEGIDIMLALDLSGSMRGLDFKPDTRAEAAKKVIAEFVKGLKNDRVGLVVFGSESFLQCPLTLDYGVLLNFLDHCKIEMAGPQTAIGMAIANGANHLRTSKAKSKVIILLTDGANTAGKVSPLTAAEAAKAIGVRVYTIGMGRTDTPMIAVEDPFFGRRLQQINAPLDEETLKKIAATTRGKYFRATDRTKLRRIYDEIWRMEKTKMQVSNYNRYRELAPWFLLPAALMLAGELTLAHTVLRKLP